MTVTLWNIEGLEALMKQLDKIEADRLCESSILVITESLVTNETFTLPGYYSYIQPARRAVMGNGICIFAKPETNPKLISKSDNHVAVRCSGVDIIGFYFRPQTPVEDIAMHTAEALTSLDDDGQKQPSTIVVGDFNTRIDDGDRGTMFCQSMTNDLGLELWNEKDVKTFIGPTGSSTIDLIFSQIRPLSIRVRQSIYRRHCQVISEWNIALDKTESPPPHLKRTINSNKLLADENLHHVYDLFYAGAISTGYNLLSESLCAAAPRKNIKGVNHKPWFDKTCLKTKKLVMKSKGTPEYWKLRVKYKNLCKVKRKKYEEKQLENRISRAEIKPWELFSKTKTRTIAPVPLEEWNTHFTDLLNPDEVTPSFSFEDAEDEIPAWCNEPFSEAEVAYRINKSSNNKAPGYDRIVNEHMKESVPYILNLWVLLMNACFWFSTIPSQWRISKVIALFKGKGSISDPSNYRGIALMSTAMKILTGLINQRLSSNISNLLPEKQFGFRPGKGTKDAIDKLISFALRAIRKPKGKAYCCFVDFHKAFDSCDRGILLRKLHDSFNVKGNMLKLIANILRTNMVRIFDGLRSTDPIDQTRGVLQGDSLSPTLFICYLTDLASKLRLITNLDFLFYADDLAFFSEDPIQIQAALDVLHQWCLENKMKVNTSKTKIMKFRKAGRLGRCDRFKYADKDIEIVSFYDYLGVTLTPSLCFTKHIQRRKIKAMTAIGSLSELSLTSVDTALKIFDLKIKPILIYGIDSISSCLTLQQMKSLDSVKSIFLKKALCISKFSSSTLTFRLCETKPLCLELEKRHQFDPETWNAYLKFREEREKNFVVQGYSEGPGFVTNAWKRSNQRYRHVITRTTAHGFHHLLCLRQDYHVIDHNCFCKYCFNNLTLYHFMTCDEFAGDKELKDKYRKLMYLCD